VRNIRQRSQVIRQNATDTLVEGDSLCAEGGCCGLGDGARSVPLERVSATGRSHRSMDSARAMVVFAALVNPAFPPPEEAAATPAAYPTR